MKRLGNWYTSKVGESEIGWPIAIVLVFLVISCLAWVVRSNFEKNTFNKFTEGPEATLCDAMFSQLRVTSNTK